jgi:hypothetical protein
MLVLSWRELELITDEMELGFKVEYHWENFIIRLWLYRITVKTLCKLGTVASASEKAVARFDEVFKSNGRNGLKALRDMIEHFDDYAAGMGRGPAAREGDLDPFRHFTKDRYERGQFILERVAAYDAAMQLRAEATDLSKQFITWFHANNSST